MGTAAVKKERSFTGHFSTKGTSLFLHFLGSWGWEKKGFESNCLYCVVSALSVGEVVWATSASPSLRG